MSNRQQTDNDEISAKQMKEAIIRSGYLLEQRVEDILRKEDYFVQANPVFPYPDTEKSGEYDIDAVKSFGIYKPKQEPWEFNAIHLQILCECKHNPQPLVFFIKEATDEDSLLDRYDIKLSGFPLRFKEEFEGKETK